MRQTCERNEATMKQPKPWFWKARGAWYVQVDGKQIRLHENERKAHAAYHHLMAMSGRRLPSKVGPVSVLDAAEACIRANEHLRPNTVRLYRDMLGPFAVYYRARRLDDITTSDVVQFVACYQGTGYKGRAFGDSTRALMFRFIKTLFRWARDTGVISINPIHGATSPWRIATRRRAMTESEYHSIMSSPLVPTGGKEVFEFLWRTGARPGEIVRMEARHLDAVKPIARLQPTEHKTGTKTGLQREVVMPPDLMGRLRAYASERPRGPLLVNEKGKPWNPKSISEWFQRARKALRLDDDLVLYMARHAFVTRLVEGGRALALVAKIAGHTHAETIQKVYYHPDLDAMADIVGEGADASRVAIDAIRSEADGLRKARRREKAVRAGSVRKKLP